MTRDLSRADVYDLARVARSIEHDADSRALADGAADYLERQEAEAVEQIGPVSERIGIGDIVALRARGSLRVGHVTKLNRTRLVVGYALQSGGRRESVVNRKELLAHQATPAEVEQ